MLLLTFLIHTGLYSWISWKPKVNILLRLFPFSQNRQGILSTRLYFYEPKNKCPCLNCLLPKRFTVSTSLDEKNLIHLDIPYQPFHSVCTHYARHGCQQTKHSGASLPHEWESGTCHESASRKISHKSKYRVGGEKKRTYLFSISWRYIKYHTRKTLWERVFSSVILSSERSQVYTFDQFT